MIPFNWPCTYKMCLHHKIYVKSKLMLSISRSHTVQLNWVKSKISLCLALIASYTREKKKKRKKRSTLRLQKHYKLFMNFKKKNQLSIYIFLVFVLQKYNNNNHNKRICFSSYYYYISILIILLCFSFLFFYSASIHLQIALLCETAKVHRIFETGAVVACHGNGVTQKNYAMQFVLTDITSNIN